MSEKSSGSNVDDDEESLKTISKDIMEYVQMDDTFTVYPGIERMDYDFVAERKLAYSTNLYESTGHMMKGCLGAGILGLHEAYMYGGLWTSLGATFVMTALAFYTIMMLVNSAHRMYKRLRVPRLSYPDLAEAAVATGPWKCCRKYSKAFRYTVDVSLLIQQFSTCCIYQIMMATTLKQILESVSNEIFESNIDLSIYISVIALPLLAACLIKNFKYLAPLSILADVFVGFCVIVAMYYSISAAGPISERAAWKSVEGLFRFCGVCIYSIDGITLALPIENNMKSPQYFMTVLQFSSGTCLFFMILVGFFGYWGWGEYCRTPITIHMPMNTALILFQTLLIIMLNVTFAVHFWVPFKIIWRYTGRTFKARRGLWERFFRTLLVAVITAISIAFPNLNKMMSFIGAIFLAFVGFIFPAFIESLVRWRECRRRCIGWLLFKNGLIIVFGLAMFVGGLYSIVPS